MSGLSGDELISGTIEDEQLSSGKLIYRPYESLVGFSAPPTVWPAVIDFSFSESPADYLVQSEQFYRHEDLQFIADASNPRNAEIVREERITESTDSLIIPGAEVDSQSNISLNSTSLSSSHVDFVLIPGSVELGEYGNNFNGQKDRDGVIDATFTGTSADLLLSFSGYDIDSDAEVEVLLNGVSLGILAAGVNNGLAAYEFTILAAQQLAGENIISFVQLGNPNFNWGVTDILLAALPPEPVIALEVGTIDTGEYGNNFNGQTDRDGVIDATFTGTSADLLLSFSGYDIDSDAEVEVLLNGVSLGILAAGVNDGLAAYEFTILAAQQLAGENIISFVQLGDLGFNWGVTNIVLLPPESVVVLEVGTIDTGEYGNNFNGQIDRDGVIDAAFTGTSADLLLSFSGYDIDSDAEVEVLLNGVSLGILAAGVNDGLAAYEFTILAAQQLAGENIISFVKLGDPNFNWGVTDILLAALPPESVVALEVGTIDTGEYGNNFNGQTDRDGVIDATFTGTSADLLLSFSGYDIDSDVEVEVLLNGVSLGILAAGVNDGLAAYEFTILAAQQLAGENIISFVQLGDLGFNWGVTDILLAALPPESVIALEVGTIDTGEYGNNFNGQTDGDGVIDATFTGTSADLLLSFSGYDIDSDAEVEVLLNGVSLGILAAGVNDGLAAYEFTILAAQQLAGENIISFVQLGDLGFNWGVTDILLAALPPEPVIALEVGTIDTGEYGNNFNGQIDGDGVIDATFTGTSADLLLSFSGYDIDSDAEVEVLLNGVSLGILAAGVNDGLAAYEFTILAAQQLAGENIISFVQLGNPNFNWGVTDILLAALPPEPVIALEVGTIDTGEYGNNFNGQTDRDGVIDATFTGTSADLLLSFSGYDIDSDAEVEVLLNGVSLGILAAGVNDGLAAYEFTILAAQQLAGENIISFVQLGDLGFNWGVTNIVLLPPESVVVLEVGTIDTGEYGNNFNGQIDRDGVIDAAFTGTSADLLLSFSGYDIDSDAEVEVLLNGVSLGILAAGVNDGLAAYEFTILAAQQLAGENIISFVKLGDPNFNWGVTDILLAALPPESVVALEVGTIDTGEYGNNFNGQTDRDGVIDATFTGTSADLLLSFSGYDIDSDVEVEVLLNGVSLGILAAGVNDGLAAYEFTILAAQQLAGENIISFVQLGDLGFNWGVTDILLDVAPPVFTPTDTLYADQWHLREIGHLERVWAEYTGDGVSVALYDDGMQYTHHDLNDNYDPTKNPIVNGQALDSEDGAAQHGTAVAGIIAAEANGVGTVGVAFDASLTAVDIISGPASSNVPNLSGFIQAMMQMTNFDVVNHSWSWQPTFDPYDPASADFYAQTLPTLENAAVNGRGGLGTSLVRAAGNDGGSAQGDLLTSSRYTITIAASMDDGYVAPYSNYGANLLVSAPSSGDIFSSNLAIMTTDRLGFEGYNFDDYTGTDSFTGFGGTSAAAPVVTGVIALMLEANPELGWRDVQTILAYSATHTGSDILAAGPDAGTVELFQWRFNDADNWNGGGLHFSEDYGYGNVDAFNAVRMAEVWHLFDAPQTSANEVNYSLAGAPNLLVGAGTTIDLDMTGIDLDVDHVDISLSISDTSLEIFLVSPDGTWVELFRTFDTLNESLDWTFGAQAFRGSQIDGLWQLQIVNSDADDAMLLDYSVEWWGSADGVNGYSFADDTYHFTDEIFTANIFDAATGTSTAIADDINRTTISDGDGGTDWLDMSAMTGNLNVSLADGAVGTSAGRYFVTIAAGANIENAVGGDGYDTLSGNAADNVLIGMRGNDTLFGLAGSDVLEGGSGDDNLWGGADSDTFVFTDLFGSDTIFDFETNLITGGLGDIIDFTGFTEVTDFDSVLAAMDQTQAGAVFDFGQDGVDVLTFAGLDLSSLSEADFWFSAPANQAPVAADDAFTTVEDTAIAENLLADNGAGVDSDANGDALTLIAVDGTMSGTATLASGALVNFAGDGSITYDPNGAFDALNDGESADDTFTYQISDGNGGFDTATVTVTVNGSGTPPAGPTTFIIGFENGVDEHGFVFTNTDTTTRAKGVASGTQAGISVDGDTISVTRDDLETFDFESAVFTAVNGRNVTVTVTGYNDTGLSVVQEFTVHDNRETTVLLSDALFDDVDTVTIGAPGGIIVDDMEFLV